VIVTTDTLASLRAQVTMVDGGFDPLHAGHIRYFRAAAALGPPVLCNLSGDDWVARKHPPLLPQEERAELLDSIRWLEWVHVSNVPTAAVIRVLQPRYYAKGSHWAGHLPEDEVAVCAEVGTEVVFLETVTNSSTEILERYERSRSDRG
jgi:cytidyltransferase-like protein